LNFQGVTEFEIYEEILVTPSTTFLPWDTLHPDSLNYQLTYRVGSLEFWPPPCIAKKKCRKFETNIPRKGISGSQSQFHIHHIHVSISELYIPTMGLPFLLEEICGPILGICKSLTDT
jgi:hypothetical protein